MDTTAVYRIKANVVDKLNDCLTEYTELMLAGRPVSPLECQEFLVRHASAIIETIGGE